VKVSLESGDVVFYQGQPVTIQGSPVSINGLEGHHVIDNKGNITLAPSSELWSEDVFLLNECVSLLDQYAEWEASLVTEETDSLLESMSANNYEQMISLQEKRISLGKLLRDRNRRKL